MSDPVPMVYTSNGGVYPRYEIKRVWWFPLIVKVWIFNYEGTHRLNGRPFVAWVCVGNFLRMSTARKWAQSWVQLDE